MIQTHAVHAADVAAQVVKIAVQSTLDGSPLGSRATVRAGRSVEAVADTINGT